MSLPAKRWKTGPSPAQWEAPRVPDLFHKGLNIYWHGCEVVKGPLGSGSDWVFPVFMFKRLKKIGKRKKLNMRD